MTKKDTSIIPEGPYCYTTRETPCEENGWVHKVNSCPYYKLIKDEGVDIIHCEFIDIKDIPGWVKDEQFNILVEKYGSSDAVFELYGGGLLWDQVKECGVNENWGDEEDV